MSDFKISQVAIWLLKSERSVRRWCEAGLIPCAHRTPGGHWRLRGDSIHDVLRQITAATRGFARRRNILLKPFLPAQLARDFSRAARATAVIVNALRDMPPHIRGVENYMESPAWHDPVSSALAWAMIRDGQFRPSVGKIAPFFKISRRTLYRRWGKGLRRARLIALRLLGIRDKTFYVPRHDNESGVTYAEGVTMPEFASDDEIRLWAGACRCAV